MQVLEIGKELAFKNVLFATDFSTYSNAALPYALAIAHQYGAKLYAAHALSSEEYLFATPESWPALFQQRDQQQQAEAARLEQCLRGVPHQVLSPVGDIPDVLFRLVRDNDIDLLVLGTHGRTGLMRLLMGSVAEKIFRQAPCPVLTVGPQVRPGRKAVAEINEVIFATDFSDESLAAVCHAESIAQEHQAHLTVLHVLEHPETGSVDLESNTDFVLQRLKETVPRDPDLWFQPEYMVDFGPAAERILVAAENRNADLVVLGVRPHGDLEATIHFGSTTAHEVVTHATCPVLTVRG
jgi:nucleotide-binding universal stress UspA family protein